MKNKTSVFSLLVLLVLLLFSCLPGGVWKSPPPGDLPSASVLLLPAENAPGDLASASVLLLPAENAPGDLASASVLLPACFLCGHRDSGSIATGGGFPLLCASGGGLRRV